MTGHQTDAGPDLLAVLRAAGFKRGGRLALAFVPGQGLGLAIEGARYAIRSSGPASIVAELETIFRPRWVWWSQETPAALAAAGVCVATCWDVIAVHRLIFGGWTLDASRAWAAARGLDLRTIPEMGQLNLLAPDGDEGADPEEPVRPDGHLRPEWTHGAWVQSPDRWGHWAAAARDTAQQQERLQSGVNGGGDPLACAYSESTAELMCAELSAEGLPIDRARLESLLQPLIGDRPITEAEAREARRRRDGTVLTLIPHQNDTDLRNPAQVKVMLHHLGFEVPDTRSWRLEHLVGAHPVIEALLAWRKAERISTTYGYRWIDEHIGPDDRLRGQWSSSDGAAGRMTAQAGLHNLPAELRSAVAAEPGMVFVRADLGQIEPRVLAAVSRDPALARASAEDDLYAPVAARLGVQRSVAKVAVLAAMYGQTSGTAGEALQGLESAYPIAMRYLKEAYESGRAGRDVRTFGGRLVRMGTLAPGLDEGALRAGAAARGRYARNAVIQGAAAEVFKAWAVTVRARTLPVGARIVLCLHDELLVHTPRDAAPVVSGLLESCLRETTLRWYGPAVRFVAEVSVIDDWSQAKA